MLGALEAFMHVLMGHVEDAGLQILADNELTFSQARVIMALGKLPEPTPINELANRINLSVASAGRNVEQLVQTGIVDRVEDDADRRIKRVSLSAKGRDLISDLMASKRSQALAVLNQLEPDDRVRLLAAFTPVIARFGATECFSEEITA